MHKIRLCFRKYGQARWISHLDLMHTLQRAFVRARLPLYFTEGFNPHPYLSVARPLPVGVEGHYELLDFALAAPVDCAALPGQFNAVLPAGLLVTDAYPAERSFSEIAWSKYVMTLHWDEPRPAATPDILRRALAAAPLLIQKKSKRGDKETDIAPLMREMALEEKDDAVVRLSALLAAGTASLNPSHVFSAMRTHAREVCPESISAVRLSLLDDACVQFV